MNDNLIQMKAVFTAIVAGVSSFFGVLALPFLVMALFNTADFITALAAAKNREQPIKSSVFINGIIKKLCMWIMVGMGAAVDWLLGFVANTMGITIGFTLPVAIVVTVWFIINEAISILENIDDIGGSVPPFLRKLIELLHRVTEEKANIGGKDNV